MHILENLPMGSLSPGNWVAAPRVHPDENELLLETHDGTAWPEDVIDHMQRKGFGVKTVPEKVRFGRVHIVRYDARQKRWTGAADPDLAVPAAAPNRKPAE